MMAIVLLVLVSVLGCGNAERTTGIVGCLNYQYMYNETCYPCPTNCKICVSATNCTVCQRGFYGPVCKDDCDTNCTGTCHKHHGHCTYGCPDGTYPADDNSCQPCSDPCTICTSKFHCVLCKDGPCQETCQEYCVQCNISSGQCLKCNDSFSLQDGQCRPQDTTERTRSGTVLVIVLIIIVVVILISIAVLVVRFLYKRRSVIKKENTKDTELSTLENVERTIPLFTKDEDISSVEAECLAEKDEQFPKSTSEHDDDDISDIDENAVVLLSSEDVIPCQNFANMSEEAPGTVPEPEPETSEIHKPQDDGSSYMDTSTMPSEFEAQLKFKPYDSQQLSPTEPLSGLAMPSEFGAQLNFKPYDTQQLSPTEPLSGLAMPSEVVAQLNFKPYDTQQLSPTESLSGLAMTSEFGAQLNFKPYDTQQLSPSEKISGIVTPPNMYYQDSPQLVIKHTSTKSKAPGPYARKSVVRKEDLTSKLANQIADEQREQYM